MKGWKHYTYTNGLGYPKILDVNYGDYDSDEGYFVILWDAVHGEFCGSGRLTPQKLDEWLTRYNAKERN